MPTEKAEYTYYVFPIGQLASKSVLMMLAETDQEDPNENWETLELSDGTPLRVQPISERQMNIIYRSKRGDFKLRVDYQLYRKSHTNGKVTPVPESVFKKARPNRVVKKAQPMKKRAAWLKPRPAVSTG